MTPDEYVVRIEQLATEIIKLTNEYFETHKHPEDYYDPREDALLITLLSRRTYNALSRGGINTIGELRRAVKSGECMRIRAFGVKSYNECVELLKKYE